MSDEELARQSQEGSFDAFEDLVRRYERRVYAFVWRCCHHERDAREITQDTFVRAFQAIGQFDPRRAFGPWLFTIARRKCVDVYRSKMPVAEHEPAPEADTTTPADTLAQREEAGALWDLARRCLPPLQFQALWLRYAEEMNVEEIATALGKTRMNIKICLFRARQTLAGKLPPTARRVSAPVKPAEEAVAEGKES